MTNPKIVLASGSPRRRELLRALGLQFEVAVSNVDEEALVASVKPDRPNEIVMLLAEAKARDVAEKTIHNSLVIGADTIVWIDGAALNKPKDAEGAVHMLMTLSGRTHQVYTGIAIAQSNEDGFVKVVTSFDVSNVEFKSLTEREIRDYAATEEPMDKAGAYGIQKKGANLIKSLHGDYYNVVGLPLSKLHDLILPYSQDFPAALEQPTMLFPIFAGSTHSSSLNVKASPSPSIEA